MIRTKEVRRRFLAYNPEPDYLFPPGVHHLLAPRPLCFFLHCGVERLDRSAFEENY
jgi:hypothetical protein